MKKDFNYDIIIDKLKIYSKIAPKLPNVHNLILEKIKLNIDDFSGGCQMTVRKINNFCKEFNDNSTLLKEQITDRSIIIVISIRKLKMEKKKNL